jgi:uncharacterized membrane protein
MRFLSAGRFFITAVVLACALASTAHTAEPAANAETNADADRGGGDIYGIVNLAPPWSYGSFINARNQAVFEYLGADGRTHAAFFNGDRIADISPVGNDTTFAAGLNEGGNVILDARFVDAANPETTRYRPSRWSAARGHVPLPSLSPDAVVYMDEMNERSDIAGVSVTSDFSTYRAVRWTSANRLLALSSPAGIVGTSARSINDRNAIVGEGTNANGQSTALVWNADGRPTNLGTFGAQQTSGLHINNQSDILGWIINDVATRGFFLWSPGKPVVRMLNAYPTTMNEAGEVIGVRPGPVSSEYYAFLYSRARGLINLHPPGKFKSDVVTINDDGVSVGAVQAEFLGASRAYRWSRTGVATDLNTRLQNPPPGLVITEGLRIAANGDIVANSNAGLVYLRRGGGGTDAPVLGPIQIPEVRENALARLSASFRDRNARDTHTATVDWDDGRGPLPAAVRKVNGIGQVLAEHTYPAAGDYQVTVVVTDSARRSTTTSATVWVGAGTEPQLRGEGILQTGTAPGSLANPPAARTSFRLAAPLEIKAGAATPFAFRLLGRTAFTGEQLDRIALDGNRVRLEGTGRLNNRSGYRFVVDAEVGEGANPSSASRMAVRIVKADGAGAMQTVAFEAGHSADVQGVAQPEAQIEQVTRANFLHSGSLRLTRQTP